MGGLTASVEQLPQDVQWQNVMSYPYKGMGLLIPSALAAFPHQVFPKCNKKPINTNYPTRNLVQKRFATDGASPIPTMGASVNSQKDNFADECR